MVIVTDRGLASEDVQPLAAPLRVGLFGLLGSGNSGNDVSMETVLTYLREVHPDVTLDAMCGGPEQVRAKYGLDAVPMFWYQKFGQQKAGVTAGVLKVIGKGVDTIRTVFWVRQHDAVIVPGAGALETTLPQRAWGFPYALFVLTLSGKLFGTKVALVSVGADTINKRVTRWLSNSTARLAFYGPTATVTRGMQCSIAVSTHQGTAFIQISPSAPRRRRMNRVSRISSVLA